jgi:T-complex protein 1 subunit beta
MNIARTTLSSKVLSQDKEHFAKLAVDAVMRLKVNGDYPTYSDSSFGGFSK